MSIHSLFSFLVQSHEGSSKDEEDEEDEEEEETVPYTKPIRILEMVKYILTFFFFCCTIAHSTTDVISLTRNVYLSSDRD